MPPETIFQQYKKWWDEQDKITQEIKAKNPHFKLSNALRKRIETALKNLLDLRSWNHNLIKHWTK